MNWGKSRVYLLGILYAGPQLTVTGEIKVVTIPNVQQKALSVSHIPNNLGYIIKSSNPQPPSRNDIELKEKRVDAEKDAQSGGNRHKGA